MYSVKRRIRDMKMRNKIFSCFACITIVSVLLVSFLTYNFAYRTIWEKSASQTQEIIQQLSQNVEHNVRLISEKLSFLAFDSYVQKQLRNGSGDSAAYSSSIERSISKIMVLTYYSHMMRDITIYGNDGQQFRISSDTVPDERDYGEYLNLAHVADGRNIIVNVPDGDIQIVKEINDITTIQSLGVLRASLKKTAIASILREVQFPEGGEVVLFDRDYTSIVGGADYFGPRPEELFIGQTGLFERLIGGDKYCVVYQKSDYTGWLTVGLLPLDMLSGETRQLQMITLGTAFCILLCCVVLSQLLNHTIVSPLKAIAEVLKKVSGGDFSARLPEERRDEIGELNAGINSMIVKTDALITDVYRGELLKKESEFRALQAQINPHFLYNTLDTINWMARKEGMDDICAMVKAIGDLMRISISNKHSFITVADELRYIEDYLYIQKVRYRERVSAQIEVEEALQKEIIPKLIIQPIVENAVVHGIEGGKKRGLITIGGRRDGSDIVFTVEDNGVGMSVNLIAAVLGGKGGPDALESDRHTSMGVYTVHQRIRYLYGEQYGVSISSQEGAWTRVEIRIPYHFELPPEMKDEGEGRGARG